MVTWPANVPVPARAFVTRQVELREKLRWAPPNSRRRRKLEAELRAVVLEELRRETGHAMPDEESGGARPFWWTEQ